MMEMLCEKVDYLFEAYMTDSFVHYAADVYKDNRIVLDILKYSFEELDSDERVERCRKFIQRDYPATNSDAIVYAIRCLLLTLNDWEQLRGEDY